MPELTSPLKPRRSYGILSVAVIAVAAVIALAAAWGALVAVERTSKTAVGHALFLSGEDWAEVGVNGLQVILSGDAPSEASRFAALSAAAREVDGARVIDQMALPEAVAIVPPRFSVEMLRNEAGISLIGLIPAETDREALTTRMRAIDPIKPVADFLETAEYSTPDDWQNALDFSLYVAEMLPRSKISMDAGHVAVEAIATSPDQKRDWEQQIRRERPAGLRLALDIRAPLDVISPYIVRFLSDEKGARFDACTAYTPADRNKIISAGIAAGVKGTVGCTIGLGVPSPDWPDAVARGIMAVHDMGGGSLTFSDADITLIAPVETPQDTFDRVIGELEADLPEVFSLHGVLTEPETGPVSPAGPPEFIATLGDGGAVQLRGRVASEQDRTIVETLARARFGTRKVYAPLRLDPALPASWAARTLAGLEALDQLVDGRVVVRPDVVTVSGSTGDKGASAEISRLLSEKLGKAEDFRVNVKYEEALDPVAAMPTPQECEADVNGVLAQGKIAFAPGSAEIERSSSSTVDRIAEILKTCPDVAMEIGGYTDSQGREEMNQALSQRRAEAVVSALLARRVLTTNLKAFGYGEDSPIADNDTDEGREANRRIEFSLVGETRPRAEATDGDAPTIRPLARPTHDGTDGSDAGEPVEDEAVEPETETAAGAVMSEDTDEAAPETPDEAVDEGAVDAAGDDAEPDVPQEPDTEAGSDPEAGAPAAAEETTPDAGDETVSADTAAETGAEDGAAAPVGAATESDAVDGGEDDTASSIVADAATDPDAQTAETGAQPVADMAADAADPATSDAGAANPDAPDLQAELTETATASETAPELDPATGDTESAGAQATETAPGDVAPSDATDLTGSAEDEADIASDEAATATETPDVPPVSETPEATADAETGGDAEGAETGDSAGADLAGDTEATGVNATPEGDELPEASDPTEEPVTDAAPAADAETASVEGEAAETAADDTAAAATDADQPSDIPSTRPRARPPIVVHPDLAGIRPRPRPAEVLNAPTTE